MLNPNSKYSLSTSDQLDLSFEYQQYARPGWIPTANKKGGPLSFPVGGHKPEGLWYAFGNDWVEFEKSEKRRRQIKDIVSCSLFELEVDTSKFIILSNTREIEKFHNSYAVDGNDRIINWLAVSQQFEGIELNPFDLGFSDLYWYKSFDLSSGCIWNLKTIRRVALAESNII